MSVKRSPRQSLFFTPRSFDNSTTLRQSFPWIAYVVVYADTQYRLRPRQSTFFFVSRRLDCTFATFDFKSTSRPCFTDPSLICCYCYTNKPHARSYGVHVEFRHGYAFSVSFTEPRLMSTPAETESQPRIVFSLTPPTVYAEVFSISENTIAPV